ncbi:hypothetical protein CWI42_010500 [Ordospora colligata]|uniref:Elongator complex protein 2 n=1 Tax=Ordospora colligata OC4 TaxID=1354746 RepID=A0A0B2UM22_9MICR|nr:uncharacterized protein M896_010500 [Ordospora colligata OC4]KHN70398.1 hypothetical protein M896_010500 [Ordospora colligata OC4]TBU17398.1 hypothetical protein CWI40_010500 [Ordospora colligata]TBU19578.1 hypothetical protein CWI42_010500 [Ordospora colligata]
MRCEFMYAGCIRKSKVSAKYGNGMAYGSMSNVIVTDERRVLDVIYLDGEVNALESEHGMLVVGDCKGNGYVIDNKRSIVNKCEFGDCIVAVGVVDAVRVMFCTMLMSYVYDVTLAEVKYSIVNRWIPTCVTSLNGNVFVGCRDGRVIILDGSDRFDVVGEVNAHNDSVQDIKSKVIDGKGHISTASQDETVKIWGVNAQGKSIKHIQTLNGHSDWVFGLFWKEDGDLLSSSGDCSIVHWKRQGVWMNEMRYGGEKMFLNVLMIGQFVIGQSYTGGFYKFGDELEEFVSGHTDEVRSIDWKESFILTGSFDMTSRIFYRGMEVGRPQTHGYGVTAARFLNINDFSIVSCAQETILRVYEPTQVFYMCCVYAESKDEDVSDLVAGLCVENNGKDVGGKNSKARETVLNERMSVGDFFENVDELKMSAVRAELSLTNEVVPEFEFECLNEQVLSVSVFNEIKKVYGHYFDVSDVAVSERFIVSCNRSLLKKYSGIFVWNRQFEKMKYIEEHDYGIERLKFSWDGRYLAAASKDKSVSVYVVEDEIKMIRRLKDHKRVVWDCAFSRDSKYLATCSRDKCVIVYAMPDIEKRWSMKFDCEVTSVCFSPVLDVLVAGLESGEVMEVDVCESGMSMLSRKKEHSRKVNVVMFNRNGSRCATGGADGLVKEFVID